MATLNKGAAGPLAKSKGAVRNLTSKFNTLKHDGKDSYDAKDRYSSFIVIKPFYRFKPLKANFLSSLGGSSDLATNGGTYSGLSSP
jgi:hypothetical protein